jgi:polysaccharide export outer membrane protein
MQPADVEQLKNVEASLTLTPEKAAFSPDHQIIENVPVPNLPEYRLGPADVVEIVYHIRYESTGEPYRLDVQDKISVTLPYYPRFSTTVLVRTDGKITLPLLGDVQAASRTPQELAATLNKQYSKYLKEPHVTVALEEFNAKIEELKKAITTAPRGQSKIAPVAPDGRIAFPLVGNVVAEGLTLAQLQEIVNDKYSHLIRNLDATLILNEIHHYKFYIIGEVERPGVYEMPSRTSLLDALSMANGFKKTGDLSDVIVFRNDGLERPIAFKVDLKAALKEAAPVNLAVRPADIIYVPKGRIDNFNDLVEKVFTKGLWAIVPFSSSFSAYYNINGVRVLP